MLPFPEDEFTIVASSREIFNLESPTTIIKILSGPNHVASPGRAADAMLKKFQEKHPAATQLRFGSHIRIFDGEKKITTCVDGVIWPPPREGGIYFYSDSQGKILHVKEGNFTLLLSGTSCSRSDSCGGSGSRRRGMLTMLVVVAKKARADDNAETSPPL